MTRSWQRSGYGAGRRAVLLGLVLIGSAAIAATAVAETPLERGRYLFGSLLACRNCHDEPDGARRELAGGARFGEDGGTMGYAPNITPDLHAGIGAWSDAAIARAIREGIRPDGSYIAPVMPFELYRKISDSDIRAIVAYLRSVPPADKLVPRTNWGNVVHGPYGPPVGHVPDVDSSNKVAYGAYLAGPLGGCISCHTPDDKSGRPNYARRLGAGGRTFESRSGEAIAGNITPDRDTGLGDFSDDQIKTMIITGVRPSHSRVNPIMPHGRFAHLKAADLDAIVAYLRSLKPVRHMIDK